MRRFGVLRLRARRDSLRLPLSVALVHTAGALAWCHERPARRTTNAGARLLAQGLEERKPRHEEEAAAPSRWRVAMRVSELAIVATPLAWMGAALYVLRSVGLEWRSLDEAWWALALRSVEAAGPTFIKLCQWAATRNDIFPAAMTNRFSKLHDSVAPHSLGHTASLLETAFGPFWRDRLALQDAVLGSGCIAQVYRGVARDSAGVDRDVAIKVVHPGVRDLIETDMSLLRWVGATVEAWLPSLKYLGVVDTLTNFEVLMARQLDLRHEAYNLEKLAELFRDDETVKIPLPVTLEGGVQPSKYRAIESRRVTVVADDTVQRTSWQCPDVLVEDYVDGRPIATFVGAEATTATLLAQRGAKLLLRMVLQYNFVHGDLHPGNLLVTPDLKICLLDAGICIELPQRAHDNMVAMLRAMLECRGRDAAQLMLASDAADRTKRDRDTQNENNFVDGIATLVEHARNQSFFESIGQYYGDICHLAIQNKVALDASFVSVALAVKIVEGLVMDLHPNFPILDLALPMFLKAQFHHAKERNLDKLSAYSRGILQGFTTSDDATPSYPEDLLLT